MGSMTTLEKFEELTEPQLQAPGSLLDGASVTSAANAAGVSRQTVSEWKNRNPSFIAVLNAGRLDVWSHVEVRVRHLTGMAVDVLEEEIRIGNAALARDILRAADKLNLSKIGPTSAQLVHNDIEDQEQHILMGQLARAMNLSDLQD